MPEIQPDILIYTVDFNNLDAEGRQKGSHVHASSLRMPVEGERVLLRDGEGLWCWATVAAMTDLTIRFDVLPETWAVGEHVELTGAGNGSTQSLAFTSTRA